MGTILPFCRGSTQWRPPAAISPQGIRRKFGCATSPAAALSGRRGRMVLRDWPRPSREMSMPRYEIVPIGWVESPLTDRAQAPCQGDEGAPPAWIVFEPPVGEGMRDLRPG